MKARHIEKKEVLVKVVIEFDNRKKSTSYIPVEGIGELEDFLEKLSSPANEESVDWKILSEDRIQKYKKAGIILRGARYREDISQKKLAEQSGVNQNEISKIENGKRTVGEKVAKRLAKVLNIDYRLLTEPV